MPRKKTEIPVPVGKKIKKIRTEKKIAYEQLANETGLSIDYLKKIRKPEK